MAKKKVYFPKVAEARQALADKALELFELYEKMIKDAIAAQEFEVAQQGLQFLLEHMPKDEDGDGVIDSSVDKNPKDVKGAIGAPRLRLV